MRCWLKLKKEEWPVAGVALSLLMGLYALLIHQYSPLFLKGGHLGYWSIFAKNFRLSGYDCWSLITLSNHRVHFDTTRHPLFLTLLDPLYALNQWLMNLTGHNAAVFIMAAVEMFCGVYALVFLFRVFRQVLQLARADAYLLTLLFFSFAHVVVPMLAPDHFILSLFILTLTLWRVGLHLRGEASLQVTTAAGLFFVGTGITLTNGVKVALGLLFAHGKRCFKPVYMLVVGIVPLALLWGVWKYNYEQVELPQKTEIRRIEENNRKKHPEEAKKYQMARNKRLAEVDGRSIAEGAQWGYTDVSTSRTKSLVENFFGEGLQLHRKYLLQDVSFTRPVFVTYTHRIYYVVEAVLLMLFLAGLWMGRGSRFLQMCMSWFAFDFVLHMVLGFAINEVYIMTSGWVFILPIAMAHLLKGVSNRGQMALRTLLGMLTVWLLCTNGLLLVRYLLIPMNMLAK